MVVVLQSALSDPRLAGFQSLHSKNSLISTPSMELECLLTKSFPQLDTRDVVGLYYGEAEIARQ